MQMSISSEQRDVKIELIKVYVPETESDLPMAIAALRGDAKEMASKGSTGASSNSPRTDSRVPLIVFNAFLQNSIDFPTAKM